MSSSHAASDVERLRCSLRRHRKELEFLLGNAEADTRPVTLDQQSVGRVSRIDAIQQQQMAIASQQQASTQLRKVEQALQRIDAGDYGACLECGEAIALARLEAQPEAELCIDCQQACETG